MVTRRNNCSRKTKIKLKPVNFNRVLLSQFVGNQESRHVFALISLKLQHFSQFFVFHHAAVAAVFCRHKAKYVREMDQNQETTCMSLFRAALVESSLKYAF